MLHPMKWKDEIDLGRQTTDAGQEFTLRLRWWDEPAEADYRMCVISAQHAKWGFRHFKILITKDAFPDWSSAKALAMTDILMKVVDLLPLLRQDDALLDPYFGQGWYLV